MSTLMESYQCSFPGCGKIFKRQEHLSRHEKIHDPENVFVCPICAKEFNRKDSLARHMALHPDQSSLNVPKKVKTACVPCRKAKTRCDGEDRCGNCIRKGLECSYTEEKEDMIMEDRVPTPHRQEIIPPCFALGNSRLPNNEIPPSTEHADAGHNYGSDASQPVQLPSIRQIMEVSGPSNTIDWKALSIQKDAPNKARSLQDVDDDAYLEAYFRHFHYHWPLVHRVVSVDTIDFSLLLSSVRMIGAWIVDSEMSRRFALDTHETLLAHFIPALVVTEYGEHFQKSLSANLCHSALLTVIFGLCHGNRMAISEAFMLFSTLVSALRQAEFFQEEIAYHDERSSFFPPLKMGLSEQRSRLAFYLYKTDAYLSLVRHQPPLISPEELHFSLPTTFSQHNANGLHIWDQRQYIEPSYRSKTKTFEMIHYGLSGERNTAFDPMLIEDIQICLCALRMKIWKTLNRQKFLVTIDPEIDAKNFLMKRQLDNLRARLEHIMNQPTGGNIPFGDELYLPLKHYFGFDDEAQPDTAKIVTAHAQGLVFSALLLYHTLTLHLAADIPSLSRLAKDQHLTPIEEASETQQQARKNREVLAKVWSKTPGARRALCHAVDILVTHDSICSNIGIHVSQDPILKIALVFAALIVWSYCIHDATGCQLCVPGLPGESVELTTWSNKGFEKCKDERDSWIEVECGYRPELHGLQFCSCNVGFFVGEFKKHLPDGWDIGDLVFGELWTELK